MVLAVEEFVLLPGVVLAPLVKLCLVLLFFFIIIGKFNEVIQSLLERSRRSRLILEVVDHIHEGLLPLNEFHYLIEIVSDKSKLFDHYSVLVQSFGHDIVWHVIPISMDIFIDIEVNVHNGVASKS